MSRHGCSSATRLGDVAGLRVDRDAYAGASAWIDRMTARDGCTGYNYQGGASARPEGYQDTFPVDRVEPMTATGLWCRHLLGGRSVQLPVYRKGIDLVLAKEPRWIPGYQDMIYWHFATLALFQDGDASSRKWGKPLLAALSHGRDAATGAWRPEDVWSSDIFQRIVLGGLSWALGRLEADILPNIDQVAPRANEFMKQ